MRLKPTTLWLTFSALLLVVLVPLLRVGAKSDPVVAGESIGHWLDAMAAGPTRSQYQTACPVLWKVKKTNGPVLQAVILDRIEDAYSPAAKLWHQIYFALPARLQSSLPPPQFGNIAYPIVMLLDGITPEPSLRQRAAIQRMLDTAWMNNPATWAAFTVARSPATQTFPEAVTLYRQQLASTNASRLLYFCQSIPLQPDFDDWRSHPEAAWGLLGDLKKIATSGPSPVIRDHARETLDYLMHKLGNSESTLGNKPKLRFEIPSTQSSSVEHANPSTERPLLSEAPRPASELNFQLAPPTPPSTTAPFKP